MASKLTRRLILVASLFLIPTTFQPIFAASNDGMEISGIEKINVNKADVEQLSLIKGIGTKKAQAIVDYRLSNGDFMSLDELTGVKGIGDSTLQKIKPYLALLLTSYRTLSMAHGCASLYLLSFSKLV